MIKKILVVLSLFFIIAQSTPIGRRWGIGTTTEELYHFSGTSIIKGLSKYWALLSDFTSNFYFHKNYRSVTAYANLGARLYPRADSPLAPFITGTVGVDYDVDLQLDVPKTYQFSLSYAIRAGVEYFFLKHFSFGINVRPLWTQFSWNENGYKGTSFGFSNIASPRIILMIYF